MANRGASASVITELAKSQNQPFYLVELQFDSGSFFMTDSYKNIDYGGDTYLAYGDLLQFSDIVETAELQVATLTASVSNIDQEVLAAYLGESYIDRPVIIYKAFLDSNEALISDPVLIFNGRMDGPIATEDPTTGKSTVTVRASSAFADFRRRTFRRTNTESQQLHFTGDLGFEFAAAAVDFKWGANE